jgi:lipopolysaccharide export system permease protein
MTLLSRYIFREHVKVLLWIFLVLTLLGFLLDFVERWDDLLEARVPTLTGLLCLVLRMPQYVVYVIPISVLLSTFITLGLLGRSNEVLAIKASGGSGYFISRTLLLVAGCLSLLSFFWAETLVPWTNRGAKRIWQVEVEKIAPRSLLRLEDIWFRSPTPQGMTLYHIGFLKLPDSTFPGPRLKPQSTTSFPIFKDVMVLRLNREFELIERIDAKEMLWREKQWIFVNGVRWRPDVPRVQRFDREVFSLPDTPEDFQWIARDVEEMSFFELRNYVRRAKQEGYDVTAYRTDVHFRVASAFFPLITALFTIPLALRIPPRAGGLALGVALSMAIGAVYYLVMAIGLAFGRTALLPPFLGAWGANCLFGLCGTWWMLHLRH